VYAAAQCGARPKPMLGRPRVGLTRALLFQTPVISRLFSFAAPPPVMLLAAAGAAVLSMLWFEGVKRVHGRRTEQAV
jgi:hypothetical protein